MASQPKETRSTPVSPTANPEEHPATLPSEINPLSRRPPVKSEDLFTQVTSMKTAVYAQRDHLHKVLGEVDIGKAMGEMNGCLKTLQTNALQGMPQSKLRSWERLTLRTDEIPYPAKRWNDESAWNTLYKATKVQAQQRLGSYQNAINYSLVFVSDYVSTNRQTLSSNR